MKIITILLLLFMLSACRDDKSIPSPEALDEAITTSVFANMIDYRAHNGNNYPSQEEFNKNRTLFQKQYHEHRFFYYFQKFDSMDIPVLIHLTPKTKNRHNVIVMSPIRSLFFVFEAAVDKPFNPEQNIELNGRILAELEKLHHSKKDG